LKEAGYKTAIVGKWQLGKEKDSPQHFGFEASCLWQQSLGNKDVEGHDTRYSNPVLEFNGKARKYTKGEYAPDITNDFICDFIEKNKNTPFFAYYPMILTHCPFVPTPDSEDWDPANRGSLTYKGDPKYFPEMVTYMDKLVGKIVAKVEELGLSENTLIIFTGDNGTDQPIVSMLRGTKYPGGKGSTKDNGTQVPLIIRWDKTIKPDSECNDLIDFSDFLPTICDAAKVSVPANLKIDGVSFLPQLQGKKGNPREWIYSWYSRDGKMDELTEFARNKNYKLYSNGQFFNVQDDFYETKPGSPEKLNAEEKSSYNLLVEALKKFENIRKKEN
jgi:arylsulfatase A